MNGIPVIDMTATGKNIARLRIRAGLSVRELQDIFYDPQTSGGLLIAVPHESAGDLLKELKDRIPCAEQIGRVDTPEEYSVYLEKE